MTCGEMRGILSSCSQIRTLNTRRIPHYNVDLDVRDVDDVRRQGIVLILTRRPTQTLAIGSDITVTVLEIRGKQVRIGVSAPRETAVLRKEIVEKVKKRRSPDSDH
jgi:carbon storage regulator